MPKLRTQLTFPTLLVTLPFFVALLVAGGATACGGGDDASGPSPAQSVCSKVSMSSNGSLSIQATCTGTRQATVTGITYDQFSRVISYNFDFSCSAGGERFTGRVNSITYNNIGQATAWSVTVNGTTCTGP